MLFTIAIPTYNNESTISRTIESAINQDFDDYEILVLNNASLDKTDAILEQFGENIRVVKNPNTVSMYENHNLCLKNANGDYIVFCHSDDIILSDALIKYAKIIKQRQFPKKYVLWGRSMFRDFGFNWKNGGFELNQIAAGLHAITPFLYGGITPSGTCYSRLSFLEVGGFILINHKLSPSDMFTMWKLALNQFEFEMSENIFFFRDGASTASGDNYNSKNISDSMNDGLQCLLDDLSPNRKKILNEYFQTTEIKNARVIQVLMGKKILSKTYNIKRFLKIILGPLLRIRNQFRNI